MAKYKIVVSKQKPVSEAPPIELKLEYYKDSVFLRARQDTTGWWNVLAINPEGKVFLFLSAGRSGLACDGGGRILLTESEYFG